MEGNRPIYNKLVRDRIPQVIESDGKKCSTRILEDDVGVF